MTTKHWAIVECERLFAFGVEECGDRLLLLVFGNVLQIAALPENGGGFRDYLKGSFYSGRTMKGCAQNFVPFDGLRQRPLQPFTLYVPRDDESADGTAWPIGKSLLRHPNLSLLGRNAETLRGQIAH